MALGLSPQELDEAFHFALELAKQAGARLLNGMNSRINGTDSRAGDSVEKESSVDIVTAIDNEVETLISDLVREKYPAHNFVGEETYSACSTKQYLIDERPTWCVDPLDGTVNYTHLFPTFCVSIALVVNHEPVVGVIYAPFLAQLYTGCRGRGAYLHQTHPFTHETLLSRRLPLLRIPQVPPIPQGAPAGCIFSCEWGKDRRDVAEGNLNKKLQSFKNLAKDSESGGGMVHGVRSLGSATLDLAYVATGGADIWWEGGCWEWDVAAGIAILREAGGLVTSANPPEDMDGPVQDAKLGSRLYLAIRPAGPMPTESGRQGQERLVKEVWARIRSLDYYRPGS